MTVKHIADGIDVRYSRYQIQNTGTERNIGSIAPTQELCGRTYKRGYERTAQKYETDIDMICQQHLTQTESRHCSDKNDKHGAAVTAEQTAERHVGY